MSRKKIKVVKGEFGEWYRRSPNSNEVVSAAEGKVLLGEFGDADFTVEQVIKALQQFDPKDRVCLDNQEDDESYRSAIFIFSQRTRKLTKEELKKIADREAEQAARVKKSHGLIDQVRQRSYERLLQQDSQ